MGPIGGRARPLALPQRPSVERTVHLKVELRYVGQRSLSPSGVPRYFAATLGRRSLRHISGRSNGEFLPRRLVRIWLSGPDEFSDLRSFCRQDRLPASRRQRRAIGGEAVDDAAAA